MKEAVNYPSLWKVFLLVISFIRWWLLWANLFRVPKGAFCIARVWMAVNWIRLFQQLLLGLWLSYFWGFVMGVSDQARAVLINAGQANAATVRTCSISPFLLYSWLHSIHHLLCCIYLICIYLIAIKIIRVQEWWRNKKFLSWKMIRCPDDFQSLIIQELEREMGFFRMVDCVCSVT